MKRLLVILFTFLSVLSMKAQSDSLRVSLLTCGPGQEVYNLFGHSAIRVKNEATGVDYVFNYGIFSFNTPNFVLRFCLGQTDYQLGVQYYDDFVWNYQMQGRFVHEQVLNLTEQEKLQLVAALEENYLPENRIYRYNYFYDNCATRPRDIVEQAINGEVHYTEDMDTPQKALTYRGLVHEYTAKQPWSRFGIDLLLGSEADKPISRRASMFVPFYLEEYFHTAQKADLQGRNSGLIAEELEITAQDESDWPSPTPLTPMRVFLLLFILVAALTAWGIKQGRSLWGLDLLVFAIAGIAGCIIAFMVLFSEHPAVSPNYLLLLLHPLHLIFLYHIVKRVKKLQRSVYLGANMVVILLFLAFWALIPQKFPIEIVPLALILLVRCISNIVLSYRKA
ncbi:MAG: DUF4105 domain-containing protein [Bacteroidaceae bacterium]|nr:DUF4105 domain-containing protein [Bacteroidaceae bacterium]MBQ9884665.1 DUF4105 domain-containing protein [Bacteroidaceae bacterium]